MRIQVWCGRCRASIVGQGWRRQARVSVRGRSWTLALVLLACLTSPGRVQAQVYALVYDPANFVENAITAVQSVIEATYAVLSEAHQVLELTPVDEVIVGGQIAEDMALLADIVANADLVWYDLSSLEAQITALFGLDVVPTTRDGLTARIAEIKQFYYRTLSYAMRTQTLVMTMFSTVEHLTRLVESIGGLIGNMQGNQTLVQVSSTVSKTLAIMEVQQSAWQRADTVQRLAEQVITESLKHITDLQLIDHPRYD
jgi:conjugal transfer/entry exclusion protein